MNDADTLNFARQLQILCGALMMGVLTFAAVTVFLVHGSGMQIHVDVLIPGILLAVSLINIVAVTAIASQMKHRKVSETAGVEDDLNQYRLASIIHWAGLEGAAFLNIVAYLLSAQWWSAVVPAISLLWMAATFPTPDKLSDWLRSRERDQTF